jgi:excinuclease ABC subunit B
MKRALEETDRRRTLQLEYNKQQGIIPSTIIKPIKEKITEIKDTKHIPKRDIPKMIIDLELEMKGAAENLDFEKAIIIRDRINRLKKTTRVYAVN